MEQTPCKTCARTATVRRHDRTSWGTTVLSFACPDNYTYGTDCYREGLTQVEVARAIIV
jgi:hypothetical protein